MGHGARSAAELVSILQTAQIRTLIDCHRSHIADWLVAHGHKVMHLLAPGQTVEHAVHPQEDLWRDV